MIGDTVIDLGERVVNSSLSVFAFKWLRESGNYRTVTVIRLIFNEVSINLKLVNISTAVPCSSSIY